MAFFAKEALSSGKKYNKVMHDVARYTSAYASAIGANEKQIAKGVVEAATDFENFGQIRILTMRWFRWMPIF